MSHYTIPTNNTVVTCECMHWLKGEPKYFVFVFNKSIIIILLVLVGYEYPAQYHMPYCIGYLHVPSHIQDALVE